MPSFQLVVFDWDGTLMDSEGQILRCMHNAIEDLGLEPRTDAQVRNIIGLGLLEAIDALYPGREEQFHLRFRERYRVHWFGSRGSSELFSGARETVEDLHAAGYRLAVATGKSRAGLDKVLAETGLTELFHASRCADESSSKPDPEMLCHIMESLDIDPGCTLMIGDTEYDLEMARHAGAHSVGVASGVHSTERLMRHQPLAILDSVADLNGWLGGSAETGERT